MRSEISYTLKLILTITFLFTLSHINATIYTAIGSGKWEETGIWDKGMIPLSITDTVIIDGFDVTINDGTMNALPLGMDTIKIGCLQLSNTNFIDPYYQLYIKENAKLTVEGNLEVTSRSASNVMGISMTHTAEFRIDGDALIGTIDENQTTNFQLYMYNMTKIFIGGDLEFDYRETGFSGVYYEIYLTNSAEMTVTGDTRLICRSGNDFDFYLETNAKANLLGDFYMTFEGGDNMRVTVDNNSELNISDSTFIKNIDGALTGKATLRTSTYGGIINIGGSLSMESEHADRIVELKSSKYKGSIEVVGDITLKAKSDSDVMIEMENEATLSIGGNFNRPDNYGNLETNSGGQLIYNGTIQQTISCDSLPGSGSDLFDSSNVRFENTSEEPMLLEGKIVVTDSIVLKNGIIKTSEVDDIIVKNLAVIKGGNSDSYIDGPITKEGSTGGEPFVFPLGKGGTYAPIEITPVSQTTSVITADYKGDPPPYINRVDESGLAHISSMEYWTLNRTAGSEEIRVSLHWTDASARGIDNLSSLVVAQLNPADSTWYSSGIGNIIGNLTTPGSVETGDPPPYIEAFTFASTLPSTNSLPVEMTRFEARKNEDHVRLLWETSSEVNSDYFMVEKSENGIDFYPLQKVKSKGNAMSLTRYNVLDENPFYGINYYRLRQVDLDGKEELSELISLRYHIDSKLTLFPNPVKDQMNILVENDLFGEVMIEIFNQQGQLLYQKMMMISEGHIRLNTSELNLMGVGVYYLSVNHKGQRNIIEFTKKE